MFQCPTHVSQLRKILKIKSICYGKIAGSKKAGILLLFCLRDLTHTHPPPYNLLNQLTENMQNIGVALAETCFSKE